MDLENRALYQLSKHTTFDPQEEASHGEDKSIVSSSILALSSLIFSLF